MVVTTQQDHGHGRSAPERSAPSADASPSLWKHLARFWRDRGEAKVLLACLPHFC